MKLVQLVVGFLTRLTRAARVNAPQSKMPNCSVFCCKKRSGTSNMQKDGVTFHIFPNDPELREVWKKFCNNIRTWEPKKSSVICSTHFQTSDFKNLFNSKRRLVENSIPSILPDCICASHLPISTEIFYNPVGASSTAAPNLLTSVSESSCQQQQMAFSKEPSKYDKGLLPKPSWSADRGGQSSTVEPPSTPEQNSSDCDPVYDTPLEARLRKQLTRKTALYVKHSKHNILLRQKVIRLKRKCASLKQVLLSNPQKKKRSQEELELIEQFNKDSTDEDISGDGSSDEEISNETQTGASKATRANMASSDDSDYEGELYDFGNFVTEQLLSLNVEESRVAQMKIKNLLAEFMKTHTVDSYSEPSTSKTQPTQAKKRKMQSKAKQHKNKAVTEPASELQTHSLSLSDTPLQFEVQQMRNDTAITQAGYVVTPTLTDGVNWVKNEGFTVLLAGFDTSPEVFMAQSEPAQAVSYGTPVDQISVKVEPGATSTESPLYADTIVKVEPSETEGSLQATEKECVVFKIEPEEPEEEEV